MRVPADVPLVKTVCKKCRRAVSPFAAVTVSVREYSTALSRRVLTAKGNVAYFSAVCKSFIENLQVVSSGNLKLRAKIFRCNLKLLDKRRRFHYNESIEYRKEGEKMATIRCKSCGRVYNYEKNGTCPRCGAYNRPPRKEIVDPDGSIRYVTTEQKVCYEEKECHEEDVRQETRSYNYTPEAPDDDDEEEEIGGQDNAVKKLWQHRNAIATSGGKKSVAAIAIITALISLVTTLVGNLSGNRHGISVQEPWESVSVERAEKLFNLLAHVGGTIYTDSGAITINSYEQADSALEINLQTNPKTDAFDLDNLTLDCYYETPAESDMLKMQPLFSDGERYTYVATLPDGINAGDCAVVLDIPFEAGVNRYWIWLEQPTYEIGEDFFFSGQRLFVSELRQSGYAVDVSIDCERDILSDCDATLTALNVNGQPYTATRQSSRCTINMTDGRNTDLLNFILRNGEDTARSITLRDNETQRQVAINLQ